MERQRQLQLRKASVVERLQAKRLSKAFSHQTSWFDKVVQRSPSRTAGVFH